MPILETRRSLRQAFDLVKNTAQYAGTILINGTQQLVYVIPVAVTPTAFVEIKSKRASTLILLVPTYAQHILLR